MISIIKTTKGPYSVKPVGGFAELVHYTLSDMLYVFTKSNENFFYCFKGRLL